MQKHIQKKQKSKFHSRSRNDDKHREFAQSHKLVNEVKGMMLAAAYMKAKAAGMKLRVFRAEGQSQKANDKDMNRINVEVNNGNVQKAWLGWTLPRRVLCFGDKAPYVWYDRFTMSATTERLLDQINQLKESIIAAADQGHDTSSLREELKRLQTQFENAAQALNEGKQLLKS